MPANGVEGGIIRLGPVSNRRRRIDGGVLVHIVGVGVAANLGGQGEVSGQKGRAKLGDQFLHGVAFVAETLAPKFTVEAVWPITPEEFGWPVVASTEPICGMTTTPAWSTSLMLSS